MNSCTKRRGTRFESHEELVILSVVVAEELHDLRSTRAGARQPDGGDHGFRPAVEKADALRAGHGSLHGFCREHRQLGVDDQ